MTAQPGILTDPSLYHFHVEYSLTDFDHLDELKRVIWAEQESAPLRNRQVLFGFSGQLWEALSNAEMPQDYQAFTPISAMARSAPSTQGDFWVWVHGDSHPLNLDTALNFNRTLRSIGAKRNLEVFGYVRHENRDFTGFIDGTENPTGDAASDAALIVGGDGASYALTQKWIHDLARFNALETRQQEQIIGRTKRDSIELQGNAMPDDSHVSRTDATVSGVKQKILRRSVPHGDFDDRGLHFVAFACHLSRIQIQLERMFGASDDGLHDQLVEYSTPESGSYWYVPTVEALHDLT